MIRVTELMRWGNYTSSLPETAVVKAAAERGTEVHRLSLRIENLCDQGNHESGNSILYRPDIKGYCRAVFAFHKHFRPNWKQREIRIDDDQLCLTGCPDRYGIINGEPVVLDYKTGAAQKWHRLQLALYSILLERDKHPTVARLAVYLKNDGTYSMTQHDSALDITQAWNLINRYLDQDRMKP